MLAISFLSTKKIGILQMLRNFQEPEKDDCSIQALKVNDEISHVDGQRKSEILNNHFKL